MQVQLQPGASFKLPCVCIMVLQLQCERHKVPWLEATRCCTVQLLVAKSQSGGLLVVMAVVVVLACNLELGQDVVRAMCVRGQQLARAG
jgi:hypothetical protein